MLMTRNSTNVPGRATVGEQCTSDVYSWLAQNGLPLNLSKSDVTQRNCVNSEGLGPFGTKFEDNNKRIILKWPTGGRCKVSCMSEKWRSSPFQLLDTILQPDFKYSSHAKAGNRLPVNRQGRHQNRDGRWTTHEILSPPKTALTPVPCERNIFLLIHTDTPK